MKDKSSQGIALPPSLCLGYNLWCLDCSWMLQSGFIYTSANEFWLLAGFSSMWLLICQQTRLRFFTALWSEGFKRARLELQDLLRSRVFRIHTMSHLPHSIGQGKSQGQAQYPEIAKVYSTYSVRGRRVSACEQLYKLPQTSSLNIIAAIHSSLMSLVVWKHSLQHFFKFGKN